MKNKLKAIKNYWFFQEIRPIDSIEIFLVVLFLGQAIFNFWFYDRSIPPQTLAITQLLVALWIFVSLVKTWHIRLVEKINDLRKKLIDDMMEVLDTIVAKAQIQKPQESFFASTPEKKEKKPVVN